MLEVNFQCRKLSTSEAVSSQGTGAQPRTAIAGGRTAGWYDKFRAMFSAGRVEGIKQ
jgi:hypothetical protein